MRTRRGSCVSLAWVLCGALTVCLPTAMAGTLYVDDDAPPGGNGGSWETAYTFLQDALTAAVSGDEIRVAQGIYYPDRSAANPTGTGNRNKSFGIRDGVAVVGGYAGRGAPEPDARRVAGYVTILSGDISAPGNNCDNSYHVVCGGEVGPTSRFDGFTITAGNAVDSSGGGVNLDYCRATLTNCTITGNSAKWGGGVSSDAFDPTLTNCTITGNAAEEGGGVFTCDSDPTLTNCTIFGNTGEGLLRYTEYPLPPGPMLTNSFDATLTNCIVWGNTGGSIHIAWPGLEPIVNYSDVQGGYSGTGNLNVDPGFALSNEPRLLNYSPCIDAGTNTPPGGLPPTDPDGQPRSLDGDGNGAAVADMGAYEFDRTAPTLALSAAAVTFTVRQGQTGSQTLGIRNSSVGTLAWELQCEADWLTADPPTGESFGELDTVTLTADTTHLSHGAYFTTVWVNAAQAGNAPRAVSVAVLVTTELHVPSAHPTIQAAIDAAILPGDEVVLADGVYTGVGNKELTYHGRRLLVRSASGDPGACIIDCEGSGRGFNFDSHETAASVLRDVTIRNGSMREGGGVLCDHSSPTLTNCVLTGNTASYVGGAVYCFGLHSSPTLINCRIAGNKASDGGGGLQSFDSSSPTLINCLLAGNLSACGGGMLDTQSYSTLINCTFVRNTVSIHGGALYCNHCMPGPQVTNCIFWANAPQAIYSSNSSPVVTYCDVEGGWSGTGNINAEPLFGRIPSPGQDGQWGTLDDDVGDLHLMPNSPCIDAGNNATVPTAITTDFDGSPRFADTCRPDTGAGTPPIVDMGAHEHNVCAGDLNCDGAVDFLDINAFVLYLSNVAAWQSVYAGCSAMNGDLNGDCAYPSFADINPFVTLLSTHVLPISCGDR